MRNNILIDTDIMVDFLRGYSDAVSFVESNSDKIMLSSIVVAELYAGVKGDSEQNILDDIIGIFQIIPVTSNIAKLGGIYKRNYFKSHGVNLADCIIAATAELEGVELETLNVKHYPMIRGINPPYEKG